MLTVQDSLEPPPPALRMTSDTKHRVHLNGGGGGGSGGTSRARLNGLECPKGTWISDQGTFPHILSQKTRVAIVWPKS